MACKVLVCLSLLAVTSANRDQSRWSRQISSYTSDISDWVPLPKPIEREVPLQSKRQIAAEPRILSEPISEIARPSDFNSDIFSSRGFYNSQGNRQLYLQSMPVVPSASQNYLNDQGFNQGFRFGLSPPNFPLTQGFVAPQYNFDSIPQFKPKSHIPTNPIRFENFQPPIQSFGPPQTKPILNPTPKPRFETPKYVDGYRAENSSASQKKPHPPQKIRFEDYDKPKDMLSSAKPNLEREEVQLLYVPVESLNRGQFNFRSPITSAQLLNTELYNQNQKQAPQRQNFGSEFQRPVIRPVNSESFQSSEYLSNFNSQINGINANKFSTISTPFPTHIPTTPKPKKLKPHQPPLAIFLTQEAKKENDIKVGDVLSLLKSAKTVPVLDAVNPLNAPEVFIGPSSLTPPEKYVKFELPYLSNIENKDKKLKQLPFFVAPLSYNTPQGFAKIPFPSPHVGSVVINSHIQEASQSVKSSSVADVLPNSYQDPSIYKERQTITQKPKISYYSTVPPKDNFLNNYEQSYYSFEPQTVNTMRPVKEYSNPATQPPTKTSSYFLTNIQNPYNQPQFSNYQQVSNYQNPGSVNTLNTFKAETTSTPRITTTTTTTKPTTTFPAQLLQTHNPYSINQAFHFSTPNENQNNFDDYKESYATQRFISPSSTSTPVSYPNRETTQFEDKIRPYNSPPLSTQSNLQNFSPEVQYQPETQGIKYQVYNTNKYSTKTQSKETDYSQSRPTANDNIEQTVLKQVENSAFSEISSPTYENYTDVVNNAPENQFDDIESTKSHNEYQYDSNSDSEEVHTSTTTTTTTTTTTKKPSTRVRGRPRYPTNKSTESTEYGTNTVTRKPARERRPLPQRPRYETNKITTEKTTAKPSESSVSSESSTRSYRYRTRGKIHFKATEGDGIYEKQTRPSKKENDLAYQRDVLHQNYPVTLMERASTLDIEAITEPVGKIESTGNIETTKTEDTEKADSNDKVSITEHTNTQITDMQQYTPAVESDTDVYVRKIPSRGSDEYMYETRTTLPPQDKKSSYEEIKEVDYTSHTIPEVTVYEQDLVDVNANKPENEPNNTDDTEYFTESHEKITLPQTEKSNENQDSEQEDNIVETTPSYNRVRIRPGVVRQRFQPSSTESSRTKNDRRSNSPITYRPAFDRRRTTMRIEEIEADLKTKQVHSRPEFNDYKQPVYKPEPVTESTSSTTEATTRRNQYKRKRPVYTTSSTEGTVNRRPYETKNRFRGRRPTEKPTEKPDSQTEATATSTVKSILYHRYNRQKLSERFNKKPEVEDTTSEDQEPNYSLHRPKYTTFDSDQWSPNISNDSFRPFNPNVIADEIKTENEDHHNFDDELDIITAKNDDDVLISVTPATNRVNKNIEEIPSTLESLVEETKGTRSDAGETAATFESMLEEVMKSLEEQDEHEYTSNVMKHKGGEIGEIPPEKIISSGVNYSSKSTRLPEQTIISTESPDSLSSNNTEEEPPQKSKRRGYWKKVKVRPAVEGIDVAESQYYSDTINTLGNAIAKNKLVKPTDKNKFTVTTYKPSYQFLKDFFDTEEETGDIIPHIDVPKLNSTALHNKTENLNVSEQLTTESSIIKHTPTDLSPGDMDLGTGSPDPTYDDSSYYSEPTEPTSTSTKVDRSDGYSFMDYLFGITSPDEPEPTANNSEVSSTKPTEKYLEKDNQRYKEAQNQTVTTKATTEAAYIPDEITTEPNTENEELLNEALKFTVKEKDNVESSSISSFMDPKNIVSTSMSTEVSHETEICFRGKCIKTNRDPL